MRIRKNAKISTLFCTNTKLSNDADECLLQKSLCQLNQSPWDVITFPSSDSFSSLHQFDDYEVYYNVNLAGNGSSVDSIGAFESLASTKTSSEGKNYDLNNTKNDYREILGFEEGEASDFEEEIVLCGKRDEKGWQCGRVVKNGNTMCDHHIVEIQNHKIWTTKKKSGPALGPMAGTRPRQTKKPPLTNPYEFYYYSGFGPSWGKKRGAIGTTLDSYNNTTKVASDGKTIKNMSWTDDDMDIRKDEKRFEPEISKMEQMEMESTYIDNDNKKGKSGIIGKKRGRKPIKARSLKSLM